MGLHFDASSGFEVTRAMLAGIPASKISLSSQEFPENFSELFSSGISFNACSLMQLEAFGKLFPGRACGIRFNPGKGSGGTTKTNVVSPLVCHHYESQNIFIFNYNYDRGDHPLPLGYGMNTCTK